VKADQRETLFNETRTHLEDEGYIGKECTISILKANIYSVVAGVPLAVLCSALFFYVYSNVTFILSLWDILIFIGCFIISVALHEILHGLGWSVFCRKGWRSIHIGVIWSKLTPYCCCLEPLPFGPYLFGGLMPLILLGAGTFIAALLTGSLLWFALSILNIFSAGGDIVIALMLLRHKNARIVDHPTKCGFWSFSRRQSQRC
jgi:hypothetical protein